MQLGFVNGRECEITLTAQFWIVRGLPKTHHQIIVKVYINTNPAWRVVAKVIWREKACWFIRACAIRKGQHHWQIFCGWVFTYTRARGEMMYSCWDVHVNFSIPSCIYLINLDLSNIYHFHTFPIKHEKRSNMAFSLISVPSGLCSIMTEKTSLLHNESWCILIPKANWSSKTW